VVVGRVSLKVVVLVGESVMNSMGVGRLISSSSMSDACVLEKFNVNGM